jgi:hypothetical protein
MALDGLAPTGQMLPDPHSRTLEACANACAPWIQSSVEMGRISKRQRASRHSQKCNLSLQGGSKK